MSRKIKINILWLLLDKVIKLFVGLFVGAAVMRYLGPNQYGMIVFASSIIAILFVFLSFGLDSIMIQKIINNNEVKNEIISSVFFARIFVALLLVLIANMIFFNLDFPSDMKGTFLFISVSLIFRSSITFENAFSAISRFELIALSAGFAALLTAALKLFGVYTKVSLLHFALLVSVESLIVFFIQTILFFKYGMSKISLKSFDKQIMKDLIIESTPIVLSNAFILLYMKMDQLIINDLLDTESLGIYAAGVQLVESLYFLPMVLMTVSYPLLVESKKISEINYLKNLRNLYLVSLVSSALAVVMLQFCSEFIVKTLYGPGYSESIVVLKYYSWTLLNLAFGSVWNKWIIIEGGQKRVIAGQGLGLLSNLILNYLLIPTYGVAGAALASLISYFLTTLILVLSYKPRITFDILFNVQGK